MKKLLFGLSLILLSVQTASAYTHIRSVQEYKKLTAEGNVIVDFYAPWCMPCQQLGYNLDKVDPSLYGVKVYKVNVEENPELAQIFGKEQIPTIRFIKDGRVIDTHLGSESISELKSDMATIF